MSAVVKPKQHQVEPSQDAFAPVGLQRPKSAARAGVRPSTRCVPFLPLFDLFLSSNTASRGGPAERAAAEEKQRQAEQEAERARQQVQEEADQRRQEALAAAEELKKKVSSMVTPMRSSI